MARSLRAERTCHDSLGKESGPAPARGVSGTGVSKAPAANRGSFNGAVVGIAAAEGAGVADDAGGADEAARALAAHRG